MGKPSSLHPDRPHAIGLPAPDYFESRNSDFSNVGMTSAKVVIIVWSRYHAGIVQW